MNPNAAQARPAEQAGFVRKLSGGEGFVDIAYENNPVRGRLIEIGPGALKATLDPGCRIEAGDEMAGSTVHLGRAVIHGDLLAYDVRRSDSGVEVRALFLPHSMDDEDRWIATVTAPKELRDTAPALAIRCGSCYTTMCLSESKGEVGSPLVGDCGHCAKPYMLPGLALLRLSTTPEKATRLSREHRIDSPAAYSVLLGILTVEQCVKLNEYAFELPDPASSRRWSERGMDPTFRAAVDARWLTVAQALQRGSRIDFYTKLVRRHGMSEAAAMDVADNKIRLMDALAGLSGHGGSTLSARKQASPARGRMALLTVLLAGIFVGTGLTWRTIDADVAKQDAVAEDRRQRIIDATNVVYDDRGRVVEISGSGPENVLISYCGSVFDDRPRVPVEIVQTTPPKAGVRLGIFVDPRTNDARTAIRIQRRGGARRWVAGGEERPVQEIEAPRIQPGAPRIPVDR